MMAFSSNRPLRIGSRASPLARKQADLVADRLKACWPNLAGKGCVELCWLETEGDRLQNRALSEFGGKGLFTKQLDEALLNGTIDLAVHSLKDVATRLPEGLQIAAVLERDVVDDVFISRSFSRIEEMPRGAVLGTASLRRQAQVKRWRGDIHTVLLRGNLGTRLKKIRNGEVDASLLARAGLDRLGLMSSDYQVLSTKNFLPAVAQGAIAIEIAGSRSDLESITAPLNHRASALAVTAERAFLAALDGNCRTPIAALARIEGKQLDFEGEVLAPDGQQSFEVRLKGTASNAQSLGEEAAKQIRAKAGTEFLERIKCSAP